MNAHQRQPRRGPFGLIAVLGVLDFEIILVGAVAVGSKTIRRLDQRESEGDDIGGAPIERR